MEALYYLALSLLQQYENFASCSVPGNSVLSVVQRAGQVSAQFRSPFPLLLFGIGLRLSTSL